MKMKPHMRASRLRLFALAVALLITSSRAIRADEFDQLNVVVNELANATLPDLTNRQMQMNAILCHCDTNTLPSETNKIRMRVTLVMGETNGNPVDEGGPITTNGVVPDNDTIDRLVAYGLTNEIQTNGSKIWVDVQHKRGSNGTTPHGV